LPFQLVKDLGWGTGLFVSLISFTLLGIEEIGIEIENPFG
jgi:putative membrane protein